MIKNVRFSPDDTAGYCGAVGKGLPVSARALRTNMMLLKNPHLVLIAESFPHL